MNQKKDFYKLVSLLELVKKVLIENKESRNNDKLLYYIVCDYLASDEGIDVSTLTFKQAMTASYLPSFESVRRTRQKVQHNCPTLRGTQRNKMMEKQEVYREFNRMNMEV